MDGEIKRKAILTVIVLVIISGLICQGGRMLGFWGQFGSADAVSLLDEDGNRRKQINQTGSRVQADQSSAEERTEQPNSPMSQTIIVHVVGAVTKPGIYTLPSDARIYQAVEKAGASKDAALSLINLAEPLQDGEQIVIPSKADAAAGNIAGKTRTSASASKTKSGQKQSSSTSSGLVNINTANQAQLETLPGIGPAMAQRIMAYRETKGPFKSVQDLEKVSGIGTKKCKQLANRVRI